MNCKEGDLAVIVTSSSGFEGVIVTCLKLTNYSRTIRKNGTVNEGPVWLVDRSMMHWDGRVHNFISDNNLRPIRDNPGADETLRWAGLPKPTEESAKPTVV